MFQLSDTLFIRESSFPKGPIPEQKDLLDFFRNEEALEAIYFGSPVFYKQIMKVLAGKELSEKESKKFFTTAYKYYTRASNRATPFALFSKVGLVDSNVGGSVKVEKIVAKLEPIIFIRLLRKLTEKEEIKQYIRYSINKSILNKEDSIVFTAYDLIAGRRYFAIQSFDSSHYISWLIENCSVGLSYEEIAKNFQKKYPEFKEADITAFLNEVISVGILIQSEFSATIDNNFSRLATRLDKHVQVTTTRGLKEFTVVQKIATLIRNFNAGNSDLGIIRLDEKIKEILLTIEVETGNKPAIHVCKTAPQRKKDFELGELEECINFLSQVVQVKENEKYKIFKQKFRARYGAKPVPLLEATNPAIGIGYPVSDSNNSTYVGQNIRLNNRRKQPLEVKLSRYELVLFKIISELLPGKKHIDLAKYSKFFSRTNTDRKQRSAYCNFSFTKDKEVFFKGVGGSCTMNTVARFSYAGAEFSNLLDYLNEFENKRKSRNTITAEIAHTPDDRVSNVTNRYNPRSHEITYFSSVHDETKIVEIKNLYLLHDESSNSLFIYDRISGKRVIPRLSNAHNYSSSKDPIYSLLCTMQHSKEKATGFNWGQLERLLSYTPRVYYKKTIVARACWRLKKSDYAHLNKLDQLKAWREKHQLPKVITCAEFDRELIFDLTKEFSAQIFLDFIAKKDVLRIYESLGYNEIPREKEYAAEYIGFIGNSLKDASLISPTLDINGMLNQQTKRDFHLGSEWLYYNVYIDKSNTKEFLVEVNDVAEELIQRGILEKWFFIRYRDDRHHLRLRFHIKDLNHLQHTIFTLSQLFEKFIAKNLVEDVSAKTYDREIERYRLFGIDYCEQLFYLSTKTVLRNLVHHNDERAIFFTTLKDTYLALEQFGFREKAQKLSFCEAAANHFGVEFNISHKQTKLMLDRLYRQDRQEIDQHIKTSEISHEVSTILPNEDANFFLSFHSNNNSRFYNIVSSIIHMHVNRQFFGEQRFNEFCIYYFLTKHLKSQIAIEKKLAHIQ